MKTLKPVNVAIVGGGWTGLAMAKEITGRTSLSVLILERGAPRKTADYVEGMDELDYAIRVRLMQNIADETITHRHSTQDPSVPVRQYGSFLPGSGVGQMRKGGARRVRSRNRSRMMPALSPQAKTRYVMAWGTNQIPFAEMRQVVDGFATAVAASSHPRSSDCRRRPPAACQARRRSRRRSPACSLPRSGSPPRPRAQAYWRRRAPGPTFHPRARCGRR